jgi:hypothetical protein
MGCESGGGAWEQTYITVAKDFHGTPIYAMFIMVQL